MAADRMRRSAEGEPRLPAAVGIAIAMALYTFLPSDLSTGPRYVVPVVGMALFVPLLAANPRRFVRDSGILRAASLALVGVLVLANAASLIELVRLLASKSTPKDTGLLLGALQVWLTNIIVFGTGYWELDRGGPVARTQRPRDRLPLADFRFSQDENDDAIEEVAATSSRASGWVPHYIDYLYVSVTNSTAFSPTDTMPLSSRAKLLMGVQCIVAFLITALVISRAVSLLQ